MKTIFIENGVFSEDEEKQKTIESAAKFFNVVIISHFNDVNKEFKSKNPDTPAFWRGSLGLKFRMRQHYNFTEEDNKFNVLSFLPEFKKFALNDQYFFTDAKSITELDEDFFPLFIRPVAGTKQFSGNLFKTKEKWLTEFKFLTENKNHSPFIICQISPERPITKEFRFVFIENRLIDGCLYLDKGKRVDGEAPDRTRNFVKEIAKQDFFLNFPHFVVDICESYGKMKLLEINSIHTSSFYSCNLDKIYERLSSLCNG